jgi:hypothetical protein
MATRTRSSTYKNEKPTKKNTTDKFGYYIYNRNKAHIRHNYIAHTHTQKTKKLERNIIHTYVISIVIVVLHVNHK